MKYGIRRTKEALYVYSQCMKKHMYNMMLNQKKTPTFPRSYSYLDEYYENTN